MTRTTLLRASASASAATVTSALILLSPAVAFQAPYYQALTRVRPVAAPPFPVEQRPSQHIPIKYAHHSSARFVSEAVATKSSGEPPSKERLFEDLGVGIKRDYKMRLPLYKSDITDGLSVQCIAATMFLFFACLAPAIGFGGLFGIVTNGAIGTVEMVSSTAASGLIYAVTAAQPLTIIGSTGPVLAFVACLAQLSNLMNVPFLPLYAWTGLWTAGILFISAVTSSSNLVKVTSSIHCELCLLLILRLKCLSSQLRPS